MNPEIDPAALADDVAPEQVSASTPSDDLAKAQTEIANLKDAFLRAKAETDNVRKIAQADVAKAHKFALERFASELLPVKDALESALATKGASAETVTAGVELTLKQLVAALDKARIVEIDAAPGAKFDPHKHQAMAMIEADQPPNTIVQVFQKGYLLNDRVLRPALVAVSKPRDGE